MVAGFDSISCSYQLPVGDNFNLHLEDFLKTRKLANGQEENEKHVLSLALLLSLQWGICDIKSLSYRSLS